MAQVTSPIILDSTGQQIHSDLQQIKNVLTTPSAAADITFDNTETGMQADDVQDAITELKSNLTDLEDRQDLNSFGTPTTLTTSYYTTPCDGYLRCGCYYGTSHYIAVEIKGADDAQSFEVGCVGNVNSGGRFACFVRKGMKLKITANSSSQNNDAKFYPLV